MNDLELLDVELADMRSRFQKAAETLDELSLLQEQFASSQQALADFLVSSQTQKQSQSELAELMTQMQQTLNSKYEFLQTCLEYLKAEVATTTTSLGQDLQDAQQAIADLATTNLDQSATREKIQWLEGAVHNLDRLVYTDHTFISTLEQRVTRLKRTTNVLIWLLWLLTGALIIAIWMMTQ